jgi:hypothetical protein
MTPVHMNWPIVREASDQWEVVGEVAITNSGTETIDVATLAVQIINAAGSVLTERVYGIAKFTDTLIVISNPAPGTYIAKTAGTNRLAPTDFAFGHVAALAGNSSLPVRARVTATFTNGKSETAEIPLYEFDSGQQTIWPVPFGGYDWAAMGTAEAYHHFGGIIFSLGTNTYNNGERFAVDMIQFDAQYKFSTPPDSPNKEDYYSWGNNVLSAGTGTVVAVEKSRSDQEIGTADQTRTGQAGNYVVIQHGPGLFSYYAHMMNNSATVNIGDSVSAGQVIGKIGNSGDTTAPHLHFQFMDNKDYFVAQGLPARFWNSKVKPWAKRRSRISGSRIIC